MVTVAEVYIWDTFVGALTWQEDQKLAYFQYDFSFIKTGWDLSPIKMPLKNGNVLYSFPELRQNKDSQLDTFKGLPGLIADVLPDRYGNQMINFWLQKNNRPANSMNPVEQLCFIGSRGMGALTFKPSYNLTTKEGNFSFELESLVDIANQILNEKTSFETSNKKSKPELLQEIIKVGTSAGGARPKAVIAYHPKTGSVKSGQIKPLKGYEHWLIKLDGVSGVQFGESTGWGNIEYAYYLMALDAGIDMSKCQLIEENNRAHFMTKRFDRTDDGKRIHVQTWCGIAHYDYNFMDIYSYEMLFETMRKLRLSYAEAEQMFRRMVFNVLAKNCDDHTKNFAFMYDQTTLKWQLSPAYDVCFAYDESNFWVNQQTLSINGKRKNITKSDLLSIAKSNTVKKAEKIIDDIQKVVQNWSQYASKAKVSKRLDEKIKSHLVKIN
jgi:serine/threonine-protein kinase HipA